MFEIKPEYQKLVEVSSLAAVIGTIVTITRTVIAKNHSGWANFFVELAASLLVAVIIALLLDETNFSLVFKAGIIGFCSFIARDILDVIKKFRESFVADPKGFIKEVLDMWRGK